jgi:hypothetical protein
MLHIKRPCLGGADNHKIGVGVNAWGPSLPVAYGTPTEAHLVRKKLKAPFPWFGGKSRVAPLVWQRLGEVDNYCEPFAGSAAVLLARPHPPRIETVNEAGDFTNAWRATDPDTGDPGAVADAACEVLNDLDPYVANAWRSIQRSPEETARWADRPVNELDMHAIHRWLVLGDDAREFRERMRSDPDYFDPKRAGRWVVGLCEWIGSGWASANAAGSQQVPGLIGGKDARGVNGQPGERPHEWQQVPHIDGRGVAAAGPGLSQQRPAITDARGPGCGVHGRPQLADAYSRGRGVHGTDAADRYLGKFPKSPRPTGNNKGGNHDGVLAEVGGGTCASRRAWLIDWFSRLRDRLRTVRVCSGHWLRVCDSESVTTRLGMTGLFLDPPYRHALKGGEKNRDSGLYGSDGTHSDQLVDEVIAYCLERGDSPQMRIAACGYEGEGYEALVEKGWECVAWSSQGGYANRNKKNRNRDRERLYFSPGCVKPDLGLFAGLA